MDVTTIGSAAVMKNYGAVQGMTSDGGFMDIIAQLVAGSQNGAITESADAQSLLTFMPQLFDGIDTEDSGEDNNGELMKLLAQLAASENAAAGGFDTAQETGLSMQSLLDAVKSGNGDQTAQAAQLLTYGAALKGLSDEDDSLSGDMFSKLFAGMTDLGGQGGSEIPSMSGISLESLYRLVKASALSSENSEQMPEELRELAESGRFEISKDADNSAENGLTGDYSLEASVRQAKRSLEQEISYADTAAVDYSKVEVNTVKTDGSFEENAVFNQTLDSIERAVKEQTETFTAKLDPEGLGEIIIKMVKDESGIVLSIMADNERTAQLINSQLGGLQNSLSEYNAQVNPAVVTQPSQAFEYSGLNYDQQRQGGSTGGYQQQNYSGDNGSEEAEAQTAAAYHSGTIDTYI